MPIWIAVSVFALIWIFRYFSIRRSIGVGGKIQLKGKRVLVVGGSDGIGKAIAIESAKQGAEVIIAARRESTLEAAVDEIRSHIPETEKLKVVVLCCEISYQILDVTDKWDIIKTTVEKLVEDGGPIDILINCAGFADMRPLNVLPMDIIEGMVSCNLLGSIKVTKAIIPSMIKQKNGHIVFISSVCGQFSFAGSSGYGASKFGIRGFADAIAMESIEVKKIAAHGGVYTAQSVAAKVIDAIKNRKYWCTFGFNGFVIGVLTQGCSPIIDITSTLASMFMTVIRFAFFVNLAEFYEIAESSK
ncbi:3-ketodihydrosphingosine reductase [Thelohanellus kitauei]|uniref:3-ketodihydrosphingosine reductase n=1 Tax=Thelohanellus kitauei TaxID=669202 RepID=A0A0C2MWX5_THEKT|nr:3-ketodihydrosphingosine reductase [Thelohanellus kitauei]